MTADGRPSAVYGADAVAGVVNFIMMDDFEGVRFDYQYSFYQHNNEDDEIGDLAERAATSPRFFQVPDDNVIDGESHDITLVFGASTADARGNVTAYAGYREIKEILQGDRGFSACSFTSGDTFTCAGSATTFPTFIQAMDQATLAPVGPELQVGPGNTLIPLTDEGLFNFGATNHFQRPDERYTFGAFAHYEIDPQIDLYSQLMFMDDRTVAQIAPSGLFIGSGFGANGGAFVVNCDNPFLTPEMVDAICTSQGLAETDDARVLLGTATSTARRARTIFATRCTGSWWVRGAISPKAGITTPTPSTALCCFRTNSGMSSRCGVPATRSSTKEVSAASTWMRTSPTTIRAAFRSTSSARQGRRRRCWPTSRHRA